MRKGSSLERCDYCGALLNVNRFGTCESCGAPMTARTYFIRKAEDMRGESHFDSPYFFKGGVSTRGALDRDWETG